jgi:anthranilate synthase component II
MHNQKTFYPQKKLLVIDNYDSFTYNLVQMFMHYDLDFSVHRSDKISINDIENIEPDYIVISPGPKSPQHAGISIEIIKKFYKKMPILGVCLGMQCINEAFGGKTIKAPVPVHGKTSVITHDNTGIFKNIPKSLKAARYHSLIVSNLSDEFKITSKTADNIIMGISHKKHFLHGVQFHPESFLTQYGDIIIKNFLNVT